MLTAEIVTHLARRELANTTPAGGCLVSTRWVNKDGYREAKYKGRYVTTAHRVVYLAAGLTIPDGYTIDHLCRVRACLNVAHMEPVTLAENIRRAQAIRSAEIRARKTCVNGHPKTEASIYVHRGTEYCRPCAVEASRRYRERL